MKAYNNYLVDELMEKRGMLKKNESPKQALERTVSFLNEVE